MGLGAVVFDEEEPLASQVRPTRRSASSILLAAFTTDSPPRAVDRAVSGNYVKVSSTEMHATAHDRIAFRRKQSNCSD